MRAGDWCAENGINVKTYYYWHNKIHKMVDQQNSFYEIPAISGNHGVPAATIRVGIIQEQFQLDAFNDTLFLFCGRRNDRIKGLYWDTNGFLLLYKRLESGSFRWPRTTQEALQITAQQYEWLCQGFEIEPRNRPVSTAGLRFS